MQAQKFLVSTVSLAIVVLYILVKLEEPLKNDIWNIKSVFYFITPKNWQWQNIPFRISIGLLDKITILHKTPHYKDRVVKGAIEIHLHSGKFNQDMGLQLSPMWRPVFANMKSRVSSSFAFITQFCEFISFLIFMCIFIVILVVQVVICNSFYFCGCVSCYLPSMTDSVFNICFLLLNSVFLKQCDRRAL